MQTKAEDWEVTAKAEELKEEEEEAEEEEERAKAGLR